MRIGTRSVLFGVHAFWLHPILIAFGWLKAYGFSAVTIGEQRIRLVSRLDDGSTFERWPLVRVRTSILDPRLWLAFIVHDLGYLGKPNMDGPEGEMHPELGAKIMRRLFGDAWGDLVLLHSRYYAKKLGRPVSALAMADKWVVVLEPSWLYLPRVWASGELAEFLEQGRIRATRGDEPYTESERAAYLSGNAWRWHREGIRPFMRRWIEAHRYGTADSWTPARHAGGTVQS